MGGRRNGKRIYETRVFPKEGPTNKKESRGEVENPSVCVRGGRSPQGTAAASFFCSSTRGMKKKYFQKTEELSLQKRNNKKKWKAYDRSAANFRIGSAPSLFYSPGHVCLLSLLPPSLPLHCCIVLLLKGDLSLSHIFENSKYRICGGKREKTITMQETEKGGEGSIDGMAKKSRWSYFGDICVVYWIKVCFPKKILSI